MIELIKISGIRAMIRLMKWGNRVTIPSNNEPKNENI
jgi:hypothetical protein